MLRYLVFNLQRTCLFEILNILLEQYINNVTKKYYITIKSIDANKMRLLLVITFAKRSKRKI